MQAVRAAFQSSQGALLALGWATGLELEPAQPRGHHNGNHKDGEQAAKAAGVFVLSDCQSATSGNSSTGQVALWCKQYAVVQLGPLNHSFAASNQRTGQATAPWSA